MLFRRKGRHCLAVLALTCVLMTSSCGAQSEARIVCTEAGRTQLSPDGELVYGSLPATTAPEREEYNPQGLAGWYNLARGFVNVVQPENLPYGRYIYTSTPADHAQWVLHIWWVIQLFPYTCILNVFPVESWLSIIS